ncbi:MAG: hypothetical protein ACLU9S_05295 [Oscillospiraceae bacterium]
MDKPFTDGWQGRIGLVATAPGNATEADFNRYRPAGVAVLTTRTPLTASTPEEIREMNRFVDDAAALLAQNALLRCGCCSAARPAVLWTGGRGFLRTRPNAPVWRSARR